MTPSELRFLSEWLHHFDFTFYLWAVPLSLVPAVVSYKRGIRREN